MNHLNDSRSRIMEFWRACELFSPQSIPRVNPRDEREPVFLIEPGGLLPWEPGHPLQHRRIKPTMTWRHILYGGIFQLDRMRVLLEEVFGADPENFDRAPQGTSALFAMILTEEGRPLLKTWEFSSAAWAVGRTSSPPGPASAAWLEGFDIACSTLATAAESRVAAFEYDQKAAELRRKDVHVGRPLAYGDVAALVRLTTERFGVAGVLEPDGFLVKSVQVSRRREHSTDETTDFLNSLIVHDLERVSSAVRRGAYGAALDAYLAVSEPARVDLRQDPRVVFEHVAPGLVPAGRWPQAPDKPLALSQQFAVNTIMGTLASGSGLFAVNGPPGTGKTTMLRDLVAANVVERARRLSKIPHTAAAFTGERRWKTGDRTRVVSLWREDLTGFEMVVTSANNGAVENVTTEIPGRKAIDTPWRETAGYFDDVASRVLGEPAWGLVAAKLGRKSNRIEFVSEAWYGTAGERGILAILKEWEQDDGAVDWSAAVKSFTLAYERVQALQRERDEAYQVLREVPAVQEAIDRTTTEIRTAENRLDALSHDFERAQRLTEQAQSELSQRAAKRAEHQRFQPSVTTAIFTLGKASREWAAENKTLALEVRSAQAALDDATVRMKSLRETAASVAQERDRKRAELSRLHTRLTELQFHSTHHQADLGRFFPDDQWWASAEQREQHTLWTDEEWNRARADLFIEALRLHQAFLRAEATRMRRSLQAAMDVVSGAAPRDAPEEAIRAAWHSFFFLVPVVSTTCASFDRVFSHLTQEALGWLFIDESGQAAPQLAAGAIWRSRRVVVVGDPLQLEPVVTLPFAAQQALRRTYGVRDERWLPGRTSVQQLADRANRYGTYLPGEDEPVWVGAPLRVHRRCDQPMFDVSNAIAYDGLMVYGKPEQPPLQLPESTWIDVAGTSGGGHWIPEEGDALVRVLRRLAREEVSPDDIFVISPFRDVVRGLGQVIRQFPGLTARTVHTTQGKEADVVILVLGGDPRRPRAKGWAAKRPNLLNVAVSRAKRRLYVIGDRAEWSRQRYLDVLASHLPRRTLPPQPPTPHLRP
ncbi:DEAD/DEAH box helicase [Thermocatellispora tengchongensis]|uniref:DEAD/DEAH box helicase n=1 Tax=Thermocatellispora tengchongensis TaxID=1073253 RepID=UPI00362848FE